jgi:hypothetical protein
LAYSVALLTNFVGLILSVWLGVYIITHSRRSLITWLSGLTLWVLADVFAHILLGIFSSPAPASQPLWLRLIFPIWPLETYKTGMAGWTQGWAACLGVMFWYHTTTLVLPGRMKRWRMVSLIGVYAIGIFAMLLLAFTPYLFTVERADPFLVDTLRFGFLYPFLAFFLILFSCLSVYNLVRAAQQSPTIILKKQIHILVVASLAATLATIIAIFGSIPGSSVPAFLISLPLLVAVCCFGFGIARYSTLMEQRVLRRDFIYNGTATSLVVLLYLGIFWWLNATYDIPDSVIVFLIPLVILSHSLIEEVRLVLDRLIYDRRTRDLRANIRKLGRLAGEQAGFSEMLSRTLETICNPVRATYGVVLTIENGTVQPAGAFHWHGGSNELSSQNFLAEDVCHLQPGSLPEPFIEATLLIPLYVAEDQVGTLVLGRPENGIHYSYEDVQFLQDPCDHIAELIVQSRRINDYLNQVVQIPAQPVDTSTELVQTKWVEDVLQNFYNYAYLGDSPLVNLKQVQCQLTGSPVTYVDRGKAVYQAVTDALEKLRPAETLPAEPIPRDWFPYLILYNAYLEGMSNRDIMLKLYISEGTFNRTRRSALRCLARVLSEIEAIMN